MGRPALFASTLVVVALAGCGGSGASDGAATTSTSTTVDATVADGSTTSTLPDSLDDLVTPAVPGEGRTVAVVSDSEITPEIVDDMDATDGWQVVFRLNAPGAQIDHLDPALDAALDVEPEVLVYAAGANDVAALGVPGMLEALRERLDRAGERTCVVYAVPTADLSGLSEEEAAQAQVLLDAFDGVLEDWGVRAVPYGAIADEMDAAGERFFAEGEVGSIHPGPAAFPRIARALLDEASTCP